MKCMINLKSFKRKGEIPRSIRKMPSYNFSILEMFRNKFQINYEPSSEEIAVDRNQKLTNSIRKLKSDKYFSNELISAYYLPEEFISDKLLNEKVKFNPNENNSENSLLYSKLMSIIVNSPHLMHLHLKVDQINQQTFLKILINSSKTETKDHSNILIWNLNNLSIFFKFVNIVYRNYPNLIAENEIHQIIKKKITDFNNQTNKLNLRLEEMLKTIEINYEILKIRDILNNSSLSDKTFLSTFKTHLISSLNNFSNRPDILGEVLKLSEIEEKQKFIFEYFFIIAKYTQLKGDYNFSKLLNSAVYKDVKQPLEEYLSTLNLDNLDSFRNNLEKKIIFYLSLEKIGILNKSLVRNIKFDNFNWEYLHLFYKKLLFKPEYSNEVDFKSINDMSEKFKVKKSIIENFDIRKLFLMRDTFDWYINSNLNFVSFHNQLGTIQFSAKRRIYEIIYKFLNSLNRVNEPNEIIQVAYFISKYVADPSKEFEILAEKNFDIEEVDPNLLNLFLESINFRTKYSIRYDHEIFILSKFKKDFYIPFNTFMDKFIIYIAKQFLYKIDSDVTISVDLFTAGLKALKILIKNEVTNQNYSLNESIIQSLKPFVVKCLLRGSKYMKYVLSNNIDTIDILTQILPYIKYYTAKDKNFSVHFDNFVLNLIKQDYSKIEDKLRIVTNITEYIILENMRLTTLNEEMPQIFNEIIAYVYRHVSSIFISKEDDKLNMKIINNCEFFESKIPNLLVNLHNVFSFDKDKYAVFLSLLESYMQEKKGLRSLRGYELLKIKKDLMNENNLFQIISNFQTIPISKSKSRDNLITFILNEDNIKNYLNNVIEKLEEISNNKSASTIFSQFNFSSLSYIFSNIFEKISTEEIIKIFKILGNKKIENYHPMFIKNVLTRYSDRELLINLMKKKEDEFFNLAVNWPHFIKNEELIRTILLCHQSKLLQFKRYEIINVLTQNRVNHSKLFSFLGSSISKVKNLTLKKKILCDFVHNCTYIGFKTDQNLYEEILNIYNVIITNDSKANFSTAELTDIIALSVISNILDTSLSKESQKIYYSILIKMNKKFVNKLEFKTKDGVEINYYPSIPSDDRYFQKSLSITNNKENLFDTRDDNEEEKVEEEGAVYMRKTGEGFFAIDLEFENYFMKKRELMYGHQIYLNDNMAVRNIMKKWFVSKLFGINLEDEYLENQLEQIFALLKKSSNDVFYEKFYLKLLSYAFQYNFVIESEFKDPITGLKVDYLVEYNGRKVFIVIVPDDFTSVDIEENKKHPDGVYILYFECIKRLVDVTVIPVLQSNLPNMSDSDYQYMILDKILNK